MRLRIGGGKQARHTVHAPRVRCTEMICPKLSALCVMPATATALLAWSKSACCWHAASPLTERWLLASHHPHPNPKPLLQGMLLQIAANWRALHPVVRPRAVWICCYHLQASFLWLGSPPVMCLGAPELWVPPCTA